MGNCCGSSPPLSDIRTLEIDGKLKEDGLKYHDTVKLLLLGPGDSGKSTMFKQVKLLYGEGYDEESRANLVNIVHHNTVMAMKNLVQASKLLGHEVKSDDATLLLGAGSSTLVDEETAAAIGRLWKHPSIQSTYRDRAKFQMIDSAAYFINRASEIAKPGYLPTVEDVLRYRIRSSGVQSVEVKIDETTFKLVDVGGQRCERRKWIHFFDGVTAVLFVVSVSEYDQVLFEDHMEWRTNEALDLFSEIANSRWFSESALLLFLNKSDLYAEKIRHSPISSSGHDGLEPRFLDYTGMPCVCKPEIRCECGAYESGLEYFKSKFDARLLSRKKLFSYVTTATDTEQFREVFETCKLIIMDKNLWHNGFAQ